MLEVLKKIIIEFVLWRFILLFLAFAIPISTINSPYTQILILTCYEFVALFFATIINFNRTKSVSKKFKQKFILIFALISMTPMLRILMIVLLTNFSTDFEMSEFYSFFIQIILNIVFIVYLNLYLNKKISKVNNDIVTESADKKDGQIILKNYKTRISTVLIWFAIFVILFLQTINYEPCESNGAICIDIFVLVLPLCTCLSLSFFVNKLIKYITVQHEVEMTAKKDAAIFFVALVIGIIFFFLFFYIN